MEEGHQKSNGPSYTALFKREVTRCTEEGNYKAAAIFGVDESNIRLSRKRKAVIREYEASMTEIHWTQERTISWNL
jgi:hypothetical protein